MKAVHGAASTGLRDSMIDLVLRAPADRRLAFRELGLAIGLAGLPLIEDGAGTSRPENAALRDAIESFWLDPDHRREPTWLDHADINDVMLATSLLPEGFLVLPRAGAPRPRAPGESSGRAHRQ